MVLFGVGPVGISQKCSFSDGSVDESRDPVVVVRPFVPQETEEVEPVLKFIGVETVVTAEEPFQISVDSVDLVHRIDPVLHPFGLFRRMHLRLQRVDELDLFSAGSVVLGHIPAAEEIGDHVL